MPIGFPRRSSRSSCSCPARRRRDGTAAGTQLHADVVAGSGGSAPAELTVSGPLVYFSAQDDFVGRELFAVPATQEPAVIAIAGIATGGSFELTTQEGVYVAIATSGGQSAQAVAANLAAAIDADPTAQAQGISARVVGSSVILVGTDAPSVSTFTDDVGLGGAPPSVPTGGYPVALTLALLLAVAEVRRLARLPAGRNRMTGCGFASMAAGALRTRRCGRRARHTAARVGA